jgi:hypothetical protein
VGAPPAVEGSAHVGVSVARPRHHKRTRSGRATAQPTCSIVIGAPFTVLVPVRPLALAIALAVAGGMVGCVLALPVHGLSKRTMNFTSFSEVAFKFRITPTLAVAGLIFAAAIGRSAAAARAPRRQNLHCAGIRET